MAVLVDDIAWQNTFPRFFFCHSHMSCRQLGQTVKLEPASCYSYPTLLAHRSARLLLTYTPCNLCLEECLQKSSERWFVDGRPEQAVQQAEQQLLPSQPPLLLLPACHWGYLREACLCTAQGADETPRGHHKNVMD